VIRLETSLSVSFSLDLDYHCSDEWGKSYLQGY
jgi:hypothetical protein